VRYSHKNKNTKSQARLQKQPRQHPVTSLPENVIEAASILKDLPGTKNAQWSVFTVRGNPQIFEKSKHPTTHQQRMQSGPQYVGPYFRVADDTHASSAKILFAAGWNILQIISWCEAEQWLADYYTINKAFMEGNLEWCAILCLIKLHEISPPDFNKGMRTLSR
jgi:hypothetical protein